MILQPRTKEEAEQFRYDVWTGDPNGVPYFQNRCAYQVWDRWRARQCYRKHRPDSIFCTQHLKIMETQHETEKNN